MATNKVFLILLLMVSISKVFGAQDGSGPPLGETVPILDGRTLDGKIYRLKSDVGSTKVINFFWVECHPCREEMPRIAMLEKKFKNVKFISVHTALNDPEVEPKKVNEFLHSLKDFPSTIVLSTNIELGHTFNIRALPHTMILDENNRVLNNFIGYSTGTVQEIETILSKLSKK